MKFYFGKEKKNMMQKTNKPNVDCWEWITPELLRVWSSKRLKNSISCLTKAVERVAQDADILVKEIEKQNEQ